MKEPTVVQPPESAHRERRLPAGLCPGQPLTVLAPMQDVTNRPFLDVIAEIGPPDYFVTEYVRVHAHSRIDPRIAACIPNPPGGRPVFVQLIGEHEPDMLRVAAELETAPIAGIDLNMGCPAPKVYRKNVGGGLLRDVGKIDRLLGTLRAGIPGLFTVKMRLGFEDPGVYGDILDLIVTHRIDLLTVHGRTVRQMYRGEVRYDLIAQAVGSVPCPVIANGNITSAAKAREVLMATGAAGVMMGRAAIRNPWIFRQCRQLWAGQSPTPATHGEVRRYIDRLDSMLGGDVPESAQVGRMKKFLNFVGQGVDPDGIFLKEMRHARSREELFAVCDRWLLSHPPAPFPEEPYEGVVARPNCEDEAATTCSL